MAEPADVVVTARQDTPDLSNATNPSPGFSGVGTQHQILAAANASYSSKQHVVTDEDSKEDDVVVVAKRLDDSLRSINGNIALRNGSFRLPCIGVISNQEILSIINHMKYTVTSKNYGEGRAGENNVGSGGSQVPISINKDSLKGYDLLVGGVNYVNLHEIAHALRGMQQFNNAMWNEYIAGSGAGKSEIQQKAEYPSSDQFRRNEARANSVARGLNSLLPFPTWNWTPRNDYDSTC